MWWGAGRGGGRAQEWRAGRLPGRAAAAMQLAATGRRALAAWKGCRGGGLGKADALGLRFQLVHFQLVHYTFS